MARIMLRCAVFSRDPGCLDWRDQSRKMRTLDSQNRGGIRSKRIWHMAYPANRRIIRQTSREGGRNF